jgi:tRNA modification GTPase
VIKNGVPVAIVGEPNVGKSTLLNTLLNDDRAIVSDIPGTTRDVIEDNINIQGIDFRFIDTAGIRETTDYVEGKGIEKTFQKIEQAKVILHLLDANQTQTIDDIFLSDLYKSQYAKFLNTKKVIFVFNKCDLAPITINSNNKSFQIISISAKNNTGVNDLIDHLTSSFKIGEISPDDIIITNARHVQALTETQESLNRTLEAMQTGIPGDLLAIDIRAALYSLGTITGHVTTDDLLGFIFSKFCIGK